MTPHPSYNTECTRPTRYICSFTFHLYVPPPLAETNRPEYPRTLPADWNT